MTDDAEAPGGGELTPPDASERTAARPPGPMMRFLVVVFGVLLLGIGRAAFTVGGVLGWIVGIVMDLLAIAIIAIAVGLVEWWAKRRRRRAA
jgi:predicted lipid-binding transport protein (Tim44 family)